MQKVLLFGRNGQIGHHLQQNLCPISALTAPDRTTCDVTDQYALAQMIHAVQPHILINATAYTAVDQAETDPVAAYRMNTHIPAVMAQLAHQYHAWLIHFSTDYVFDGQQTTAYRESDPVRPLNVYGHSKSLGEKYIAQHHPQHIILRCSSLFSIYGHNFLKTILQLAQKKNTIPVVVDQISCPTAASTIADLTTRIVTQLLPNTHHMPAGIYHAASPEASSWFDFAKHIVHTAARLNTNLYNVAITPIYSDDLSRPAKRPRYSVLDCTKLCGALHIALPHWQQPLEACLVQLMSRP